MKPLVALVVSLSLFPGWAQTAVGTAPPVPDPPQDWKFDPVGTKGIGENAKTCAVQQSPHCPIPNCSGADFRSTSADVITFHNDTIAMVDRADTSVQRVANGATPPPPPVGVDLQLRQMLISETTLTAPSPAVQFQQHTHGPQHALFVASRIGLRDTLKRILLQPGDVVEVYTAGVDESMPDTRIFAGQFSPNMTLDVEERITCPLRSTDPAKPACLVDPNCPHPGGTKLNWWIMQASKPSWQGPASLDDPDVMPLDSSNPEAQFQASLKIADYLARTNTVLRRIVVRNNRVVRYFFPLDSGCSAIKICTHVPGSLPIGDTKTSCDQTSLCRLDAAQLLDEQNPYCQRCTINATRSIPQK